MAETLVQPGRIRVATDLDSVTDIGPEDRTAADPAVIGRIWDRARHWYAAGMQPAIQVCVRHRGTVVLNRAIGHARGNGPQDGPEVPREQVTVDTPFCVFSAAKATAVTVVHMLAERGVLDLDARVCDYLPEFTSHGKDAITVRHVLTHSAGIPFATGPRPDLRRSEDSRYTRAMLANLRPVFPPGRVHFYHAVTFGPLIRELVRAADGRGIREVLAQEILDPLGFRWTNYGVSVEDVPLVGRSYVTGTNSAIVEAGARRWVGGTLSQIIPLSNKPRFLTAVVPSSNGVSTAFELSRFAELLRRGGELDGVRVLRPDTLAAATTAVRRLRPDIATGGRPLRWGTGYMLGSDRFGPFGLGAPAAFGHTGLTDIAVWADPQRELAVGVVTSGKPGGHPEAARGPALLDAVAAGFGPRLSR
jgi:CubicO group peptidase (beta-lactamase class C family)